MKLHLPGALRGALLATFALACTLPSRAAWVEGGDSFLISADDVAASAAGTLNITTANNAPGEHGWFLRSYYDANSAPVAGAQTITINELTIAPATSGSPTLNIAGHWDKNVPEGGSNSPAQEYGFTSLTINTLNTDSAYSGGSKASVKVAQYNSLSVTSVAGEGNVVFEIEDGASLHLNFSDFAGTRLTDDTGSPAYRNDSTNQPTALYEGGLATNIYGSGTLVLHGTIEWDLVDNANMGGILWSAESYSSTLDFSNFSGTIDYSNLKLSLQDGYMGTIQQYLNNPYKLQVFVAAAPTMRYKLDSTAAPEASLDTTGDNSFSSQALSMSSPVNATKNWSITLRGELTNPGAGNTKDIVLLSTQSVTTDSAQGNYGSNGFCLYLSTNGSLILHNRGELIEGNDYNLPNTNSTLSSVTLIDGLDMANWSSCTYAITLNYGMLNGASNMMWVDRTNSSLIFDGDTANYKGITYTYAQIQLGAALDSDALSNLWTRLPGDSDISTTVGGDATQGAYWNIISNISTESLLAGELLDSTTNTGAKLESTDVLRFNGGGLRSGTDGTTVVVLDNPIEATTGNSVLLMPAAGTTLELNNGQGALNNNNGLVIEGGEGSTVIIRGITTEAPENITLAAGNTLGFASVKDLTVDASKNSFDPTSHLRREDSGKLIYIGSEDTSIGSLAAATGTIELQGKVTAGGVSAKNINLLQDGTTATISGAVEGNILSMGNAWGAARTNTLTAGSIDLEVRADIAAGSTITTKSFSTNGMWLGNDAQIRIANGGQLSITGTADVGGKLQADTIGITGINSGYANLRNILLSGNTLRAEYVGSAEISVIPSKLRAAAGEPVLEFGTLKDSNITGMQNTTIRNSSFVNSSATFTGGTLTVENSTLDATSTLSNVAGSTIRLTSTSMQAGSTITAGTTTVTVLAGSPDAIMTGTVTQGALSLKNLGLDLTTITTPVATTDLVDVANGTISVGSYTIYTAPGMVGSVDVLGDAVTGYTIAYKIEDRHEELMQQVASTPNAQAAVPALTTGANAGPGVLQDLYNFVLDSSRISLGERRAAFEALTSGSITMMADSQRLAVTNTINSLRNRVIQMGNPQGIEPEKNIHAWIEADGAYSDIDQDGGAAGYEYQAWGGTVGAHMDVGNYSFGAALSASYGELTAHSNDRAEGDHDIVSLSAFARHQSGRWTQMGILSLARNEIELERHVSGYEDYHADGDASGHSITAYYEAGYAISLNEESTQVLQPLVSVMLTSARMGDFTETGSIGNAGLCSDTEDYFYGTLGIGARYQVVLAQDLNERLSFLELRARLVQDVGDETDEANVFFAGAPGQGFTVKGADVGRTGVQLGAGLSIPTSMYTTLFADVDADIRSGSTSVNGSVGVRVEF